ncbi:DUF695 domain-containing protein [Daejeonella sp. H1SJ63]|jgi:hypothetical protein|uniref:DUF695 domain-containing protein n=1 Tax=Daejeonella sp. H1SJ63 TaxID=3034145 RepID=UPI0023EB54F0|nr:DUF695 domain-containing protein [Daejeonella sp. H1SJ63]
MKIACLALICVLPLLSCSQNKKSEPIDLKSGTHPSQPSFGQLMFEAEGKPCQAMINKRYINFKDKELYPLSLFIMVNTMNKNKDGHPDEKEAKIFNELQTEIISELSRDLGMFCFVGTTTMNGYRDILLYIKEEDMQKAKEILELIKIDYQNRLESISFEKDPKWEAVASFYEALSLKN